MEKEEKNTETTKKIKERLRELEERDKKLSDDLIKLDNIKNQTQQNLLATIGGINELKLLLKKEPTKQVVKDQEK